MNAQMKFLRAQLQDLMLKQRRDEGRVPSPTRSNDGSQGSFAYERTREHSSERSNDRSYNDIKADIPDYDGKLDAYEFVE